MLKNIILPKNSKTEKYSQGQRPVSSNYPTRPDPQDHAWFINRRLKEAYERDDEQKKAAAIRYKDGTYLQFQSAPGFDMKIESLEQRQSGIRLLNVQTVEDKESRKPIVKATVYIPLGKEQLFHNKIRDYLEKKTKNGSYQNADLINGIDDISLAYVDSLWTGDHNRIPTDVPGWCEIWIRFDAVKSAEKTSHNLETAIQSFLSACDQLNIDVDDKLIRFPERVVKLIFASKQQLAGLTDLCPYLAEFRRAPIQVDFFTSLKPIEQRKWIDDLLARTVFTSTDVAVCLLDSGLSENHPLIAPAVNPSVEGETTVQKVEDSWQLSDIRGHGTEMAGVVLYDDLASAIASNKQVIVYHKIESVKILPDNDSNDPKLYGQITQQAVAKAEISAPSTRRVICMAITDGDFDLRDGSPSSWSAAIDQITSGAEEEDSTKRLFIVSAGNVDSQEIASGKYPQANLLHAVEDPAQSWNALSVGAYNNAVEINNPIFKDFSPVADKGQLSPYSSTSKTWEKDWPVKPEILLNGGNMVSNGKDVDFDSELELLTTGKNFTSTPFSTISGTSSATAEASYMAARLYEAYPDLWPETVRALLVHSAQWTHEMKKQFLDEDTKTKGRRNLLRTCGYGVADLNRAIECQKNSVNMVIQDELQPFNGNKMHAMQFHKIPWPADILRSLGSADAKIHITLSYFIEPGPGRIGWKNRYRYSSAGLRFDLKNVTENEKDFEKRINTLMRADQNDKGDGKSVNWYLGINNRNGGSIHSDYLETSAIELAEMNYIAVYPVNGWWKQRSYLGRSNSKLRYSLIVTVETPKSNADLYDAITTQISQTVKY